MHSLARLLACCSLTLGLVALAQEGGGARTELEGTYMIVRGEKDGKEDPPERIRGAMVTFHGNKVLGTDKNRTEFFSATFRLHTNTRPHTIEMTTLSQKPGEKAGGIVEIDGDTVKLAYAINGAPAPKEFKTKENQHYFVLKRVKK